MHAKSSRLFFLITASFLISCQSKFGFGILGKGDSITQHEPFYPGLDKQDQYNLMQTSRQTYDRICNGEPLSIYDIINMSNIAISNCTIIYLIQITNSRYCLNDFHVERLYQAHVSEDVICYMLYGGIN